MEQIEYAKKFTTRDIGFDIPALKEVVKANGGKSTEIVTVLALLTDKKTEQNRKDPSKTSVRFFGQFECRNLHTGEVMYAAEAYFPGAGESFMASLLDATKDNEGRYGSARTAVVITVQIDKTPNSAQGYKFGCKPFVDRSEATDIFKEYRNLLPKPKVKGAK